MIPTTDNVAIAIVLSCYETGDEPEQVMTLRWKMYDGGNGHVTHSHFRARFYAYHALHLEFPDCPVRSLARMVGVTEKLLSFCQSARYNILQLSRYDRRPKVNWFDFEALERVRNGLRENRSLPPLYKQFWPHVGEPEPALKHVSPRLLQTKPEEEQPSPGLKIGERITHKLFGSGVIVELGGAMADLVVVRFDDGKTKRLSADWLAKELVRQAKPQIPVKVAEMLTPPPMGEPPLERSALSQAKPWKPYEQRCREEGLFDVKPITSKPRGEKHHDDDAGQVV